MRRRRGRGRGRGLSSLTLVSGLSKSLTCSPSSGLRRGRGRRGRPANVSSSTPAAASGSNASAVVYYHRRRRGTQVSTLTAASTGTNGGHLGRRFALVHRPSAPFASPEKRQRRKSKTRPSSPGSIRRPCMSQSHGDDSFTRASDEDLRRKVFIFF
ncbi:unnamed protein product [Protopolystoma xenopodis]|uniref:Uncharacterized protein n=1 Tax=Protopolystoma xenopodis TaxID=117903 RepID=A0A3S5AQZ8_9PLAT|nr:unnamed protein product [Protopolystoma xenopodis]